MNPSHTTAQDRPVVLLVDDDPDTCEMFGLILTGSGFTVERATNGTEALGKVRTVVPDVVVTDIKLPGMDGFDLCRRLKRDEGTARIPVIAVTGFSAADRLDRAQEAGFDKLLMKPCPPGELLAAIRETIARTKSLGAANRELRANAAKLHGETQDVITLSQTLRRRRRPTTDE